MSAFPSSVSVRRVFGERNDLKKTNNTMEHDVEEELSESLLKLMQKLIDKSSLVSTSSNLSGVDPDESMDKRRRKKRQRLRQLKSLVETKSLSSLEGAVDSDEDAPSGEGLQEKRVKRRRSLKKLKERVARSSITSLEQEFGSQLTFASESKAQGSKRRNDDSRYAIVEESLQRALTELHYFQLEFGKRPDIKKQADILTYECDMPEWLTDPDKLSPLFESYDRKLKKKDEEIKILQENLSLIGTGDHSGKKLNIENLEESLDNLRQENSRLLSKCHEFSLQASALQDNVEREQKKNEETDRMFKRTKQELESALEELSMTTKEKEKFKIGAREKRSAILKLEEELETSIAKTIHNVEMKGVKAELEEVKSRHEVEINNYKAMLKTSQTEQANAQLETASISSRLTAAEGEIESLSKDRSKNLAEMDILRLRNAALMDEYEAGQTHLANTIRVAEQALLERMAFAQLVEREQLAAKDAFDQSKKEKFEMGQMQQTLRQVMVRLSTQTDEMNEKLEQQQESHTTEMANLKREIRHLKKQLTDKDATIEQLRENQRRTEVEMEAICRTAADENRFMMKDLHSS